MAKIRENLPQLVRAAQQGDAAATEQLLTSCSQSIYYIAYKMFKNKESAEDMTQEALTAIWKRLGSLKEPAAFYGWADRVAANLCLDKLRKKGVPIDDAAGEPAVYEALPEANEAMLPESALDRGETQRLVSKIIDGLPEAQRMCVLLYYFREMNVADIAKTMACSEGTVKSRLAAARDKIRTGVLALERKDGVKLYALPLLPFLLGDSAAAFGAESMERLLPAGLSVAAAGAAKTGLGGLFEAVKTKVAALSLGAKVGAGVAVAAVTAAAVGLSSPAVEPWPTGVFYWEECGQMSSMHQIVALFEDGAPRDAADVKELSYEVLEATPGVTLSAPDSHSGSSENDWFQINFPDGDSDQYAVVRMEVEGRSYELEHHQVPAQQLPGVTYAQYPFEITLDQPFRPEDVVTSLPDGMEITRMYVVDANGTREEDEDGSITVTQPLAGDFCSIRWQGYDRARNLQYSGELPVVVKDGSGQSGGNRFLFGETEYYVERPTELPENGDARSVQISVRRADGGTLEDVPMEASFSQDLGLSVRGEWSSFWLTVPTDAGLGTAELTLTLDGEVHRMTVHVVEHGQLPGVTYAADRVRMSPGQPLDVASLFTALPAETTEFSAVLEGCRVDEGSALRTDVYGATAEGSIGFDGLILDRPCLKVTFLVGNTCLVGDLPVDVVQ